MRVLALVSGGKDSCYSIVKCQQHGHDVVALANLHPTAGSPDELDSFCFQTVGHQLVPLIARCTGLPMYRLPFSGQSVQRDLQYEPEPGDEVEELLHLVAYALKQQPDIAAVCSGAIASDYQRLRVESVCCRLGLTSLAYLWHKPQRQLLQVRCTSSVGQSKLVQALRSALASCLCKTVQRCRYRWLLLCELHGAHNLHQAAESSTAVAVSQPGCQCHARSITGTAKASYHLTSQATQVSN